MTTLPLWIARIALAATFLGFGVWEIIAPTLWTTYLPAFLQGDNGPTFVLVHGIALTAVAIGVLSGYFARFFTGIAAFMLGHIWVEIYIQEGFTETFIRDTGLFLFGCALFAQAMVSAKKR